MSFHHRIRTIYWKELIDILRDRRTLIAMIVVPIVLYPLLMLGSIQAVSYQTETLAQEKIVIGVLRTTDANFLYWLIEEDRKAIEAKRTQLGPQSVKAQELPVPLAGAEARKFTSVDQVEARIQDRSIQIGVLLDDASLPAAFGDQNGFQFLYDKEDARSAAAYYRLRDLVARTADRIVKQRKAEVGLPESFDQPFTVTSKDLSSPPSILGQILPLILVLMTITGAIYPAIDLTAGERERGTLESLMVAPVAVVDLIIGKFLVVTTIAIMGAALNLGSVGATVYFGGFDKVISTTGQGLPIGTMIFILLCLIPFAVLMSAIMIAVCSYARTFKEAQNYVTPVILAVLVPGGIAALPATRLDGIMLVMPVGNMVLLARDFLLGAVVTFGQVAMVLLSTTLYAAAAVAVAASIFGHESVVFADSGSLRGALTRRPARASDRPALSTALLFVAVLFPVWFFIQSALSSRAAEDRASVLYSTAWLMPLAFVILPWLILLYRRIDPVTTFALRAPSLRHLAAGVLVGASLWVPAQELTVLQFPSKVPEYIVRSAEMLREALAAMSTPTMVLVVAVIPAICEELLFRGFLMSALARSAGKWTAIGVSACVFAVFHFFLFKFVVTVFLGLMLAYLCWQSRSVIPAIAAHFLHNAGSAVWGTRAATADTTLSHLPPHILIGGLVVLALGLVLAGRSDPTPAPHPVPAIAEG